MVAPPVLQRLKHSRLTSVFSCPVTRVYVNLYHSVDNESGSLTTHGDRLYKSLTSAHLAPIRQAGNLFCHGLENII